jgi:hypothetical protein
MGRYDVVINTGPTYQTQRQEGADRLIELTTRNPALMQVAGDIIMRAQDFPMAEDLATRLEKTLPPNLQDNKGMPQLPPQVMQQMQMMQQKLQEADQVIQQLQMQAKSKIQEVQTKAQSDIMKLQAQLQADKELEAFRQQQETLRNRDDNQTELQRQSIESDTERQIAELRGMVDLLLERMKPELPDVEEPGEQEGNEQ